MNSPCLGALMAVAIARGWEPGKRSLDPTLEPNAPDHWSVTVSRNGEEIVTIESNCLSGREVSPADEEAIEIAARNLLGFIGRSAQ